MPDLLETHHESSREIQRDRARPLGWAAFSSSVRYRWFLPFLFFDWLSEWAAWGLSRLSVLELLEYLGRFSILVAVIFYFIETPQRTKMKHYQAWQVINSAQGKGGSGGRIEALQELNQDGVSLLGVDVSDAFLQGINLQNADLTRADLSSADMRNAHLSGAKLIVANLTWTNLSNAELIGVNLDGATLDEADLDGADLKAIQNWRKIESIKRASIVGVRNPPDGFVDWALQHGAEQSQTTATPVK